MPLSTRRRDTEWMDMVDSLGAVRHKVPSNVAVVQLNGYPNPQHSDDIPSMHLAAPGQK